MRLERLAIPSFGPFTGFALEFPSGGSDFHVIYGPNEAGKSSLLRAIRDLLYGMQGQTPDNFLHDYKDLRIAGTIRNAAGQRLSFQRRKGNKNTLLDESANPLPDETLKDYLGVVDRHFFTNLFGLGSDELRRGAQALLHGQGEIGQALFSASLAGTPVHRILDALDQEARTLFDGRARAKVTIRPAVDSYEEMLRRSKAAVVRPEAWEDALRDLAEAERKRDALDEELRRCRTRRDWLQRCLDALPTLGLLLEQERTLAELPATLDLGADFVEAADHAFDLRDKAQKALSQVMDRIEFLESRVKENQPAEEVLARAKEIESVHQQLAVYGELTTKLSRLNADLSRAETDLRAGAVELGFSGEPDDLDSLRVQVSDELALQEAANELDAVTNRLQVNEVDAARVGRELEKVTHRLAGLPTADDSNLRAALAQTAGAAELAKGLSQKEATLNATVRKVDAQHGLLAGAPAGYRATFDLPVPSAATLRRFDAEAALIEANRARAEDTISDADEKLSRLHEQLARLERRGTLPSTDDLHEARQRRDQLWDRVLSAWKRGEEEGEIDGQPLGDAYPATVKWADGIADRLREEAEAVAQAEECRSQSRILEDAKTKAQSRLTEVGSRRAAWEAGWISKWSACGIPPGRPAEMLEWRDHWGEFRTRFEAWENAQEEFASTTSDIEAAAALLGSLLPGEAIRSLPALRDGVEREVRAADEATGARATLQAQQADLESNLERLIAEQPDLRDTKERALAAWRSRCAEHGFPVGVSTQAVLALHQRRKHLVARFDDWKTLRREIEEHRRAIDRFEASVRALADAVRLPMGSPEIRENALWTALEEARTLKTRELQAQADLEAEIERRHQAQHSVAAAEVAVAECMALSGTADEGALKSLILDLKARSGVAAKIEGLRQTLHVSARGESLGAFIERVRAEPGDSLKAEREGLDQTLSTLEAERDDVLQDIAKAGRVKLELERSGAEASECLQAARNTAARIRHDAAHNLRLRLAIHFLRQQIEQFRKQNQAPLLARAGELFRAITAGSFASLGISFSEDDIPLLVGIREGSEVGVQGMSEGTRDQLYLALRLAAIEQHQESHEPMPVVLDDLLVTFDDQRARALLPILRDLGTKSQVMLFTHHRHLVDLAGGVLSTNEVHVCEL